MMLSSSDDFSVTKPDETNGQESESSLVVNVRNEKNMLKSILIFNFHY